jgi:tRNA(Ser,Leu) C12 N-acetylase TAN1
MMAEFLVVSVSNKENKAKIELLDAVLLADKDVKIVETERKNTFKIVTKLNENDFLHLVFSSLPRYTIRIIPIHKTCNLNKNEVLASALSLLEDLNSTKKIKVMLKSKKSLRGFLDPIKKELLKAVRTKGYELDVISPEVILYFETVDNKVIISLLRSTLPLSLYSLRDKACKFVKHITEERGT